ncbi:helix-turn-helix domain-containing protein [Catellatospora sp. NPDC049111]|uniref:helix-turn-helix domain-containing protein n=1 Tax=Catellatospora sp. NPDC049111 TaxID=3155271 RepID=UPI0033FC32D9
MSSTFAAELRTARHDAGLTLEELSEASGVSVRALSDMERGRALGPQRRTVAQIADALKLDDQPRERLLALAKAGRTRSAYLSAAPGSCELPGPLGDFTGRAAELAWLLHRVQDRARADDQAGTAVISGGAGLGKTTLAVRAAHHVRDRFPGGVHFIEAHGMTRRPSPSDEMLARLLRALGVRDPHLPQDPAERAARYRQLLRERRVLVIVDDAATEAQVRPLQPGAGSSRLIVTSRRVLAGLVGVQRLQLTPMPTADAQDLMTRILADGASAPRHEDMDGLVKLLGGLPLALRIAGNRLLSRPQWSVADLVLRLAAAERRLDQLSAGDLQVAAAFGVSYEQLPEPTRRLFRQIALVPGADFNAALASEIVQMSATTAEEHLDDLVDLGLLETAPNGRYRFHDLVRLYAHRRAEHEDTAAEVTSARRRMITWLLDTLTAAGRWFEPGGDRTTFATTDDADSWIRAEAEHWFPALGAAAVDGDHAAVTQAVGAMHWFSDRWVHWHRWRDVFALGYDSAVHLGDIRLQAEFLNYVAWTHTLPWRDARPALDLTARALALADAAGDVLQQAWALHYTAVAQRRLGDLSAAQDAARTAADLFQQAGDIDATCQAWILRGYIAVALGDTDEALVCYQQSLRLAEDPSAGMTPTIAEGTLPVVLSRIAQALGTAGRADEGIPLMLRAVDLLKGTDNRLLQATMLWMLAELYDASHADQARQVLLNAAELFESIGEHQQAATCRSRAAMAGQT